MEDTHPCYRCKKEFPITHFFKNGPTRKWLCRECCRKKRDRQRRTIIEWIFNYFLTHPCVDCGCNNPVIMEFDHRDPADKEVNISTSLKHGWSLKRLQGEIEKCDSVCVNCHRKRTAVQQAWFILTGGCND